VFDLQKRPHRRYNPLTCEWVLVSPQRVERPWQGASDTALITAPPSYHPSCYLCPGNVRFGGQQNPRYEATFLFENDYPALDADAAVEQLDEAGLIVAHSEAGLCRVLCFSPRHDLALPQMSVTEIRRVVEAWVEQYQELGAIPFINWVQIFENRGTLMGTSNPHPHCQIWANQSAPNESAKEAASQLKYYVERGCCLLCDYVETELKSRERLVCENDAFLALVPFWAVWPFETMVLSKTHATGLDELSVDQRTALADILKQVTTRYDRLFNTAFPYSMGFHQRPTDGDPHPEWHQHAHFYPPLLRSASVRKYMVGYEMLAMPQRDITAENAAQKLRGVPAALDGSLQI
jgi:UDPglucose--hexose-1-phosphate uridylyltransferase